MRIPSVAIVFLAGMAPTMGFRSHLYGGAAPKTPLYNFAPGGGGKKPWAPSSGSGMGNIPAPDILPSPPDIPPPPPAPPAHPAAAAAPKASYAPGGGKPYAPTAGSGMGNYLENVAPASATPPPPPPVPPPPAPPAVAAAPVAAAVAPKASYAPGGGKPYAATGGTGMGNYLENVAAPVAASPPPPPPVPPPPATPAAEAAPTSASYLNQMGGASSAPVKPASYAPGGGKPYASTGGSGMGNYLENVAAPAAETSPPPAAPAALAEEAPAVAAEAAKEIFGSYLNEGASSAPVKPASYAPGGGKPYAATGGSGMGSYLENVGQAASAPSDGFGDKPAFVPAPPAAAEPAPIELGSGETMIAQEPVLTAINELNANMVENQEATIAVLHDINDAVRALSDKAI